jgi:ADP-glucose pyrophosphorylase
LFALATDDYWIDTGKPDLYLAANLDLLDGHRPHDRCEGLAPGATVHPSAVVDTSIVAAGVTVGPRARVVRSVLLGGAVVDADAEVVGSVVMGRVSASASVIDCVIGADALVGPGEVVTGERRPSP